MCPRGIAGRSSVAGAGLRTFVGLVGLGGFEPPTSPLSGVRSDQLSYRPGLALCGAHISVADIGTARLSFRASLAGTEKQVT
jgi:hypothetical protein